mmetsp:Transcript_60760/g.163025  ORF Transcript_60760/g.163025 Transcript_60760/m.163025 type:complete len:372 (-) Transcript_60760:8-1123(-)
MRVHRRDIGPCGLRCRLLRGRLLQLHVNPVVFLLGHLVILLQLLELQREPLDLLIFSTQGRLMVLHSLLKLLNGLLQVLVLSVPFVIQQGLELLLQRSHLQRQRVILRFHISNSVQPFLVGFHLANLGLGHSLLLSLLLLLLQSHLGLDLLELLQLRLLVLQLPQIVTVPVVQHLGLVLENLKLCLKLLLLLFRMLHALSILLKALGNICLRLSQLHLHGLRFSDGRSFTLLQELRFLCQFIHLLDQIRFRSRRALAELLLVRLHVRQQQTHGCPHVVQHYDGVLVLYGLVLLFRRLDRLRRLQGFGPLLYFQEKVNDVASQSLVSLDIHLGLALQLVCISIPISVLSVARHHSCFSAGAWRCCYVMSLGK